MSVSFEASSVAGSFTYLKKTLDNIARYASHRAVGPANYVTTNAVIVRIRCSAVPNGINIDEIGRCGGRWHALKERVLTDEAALHSSRIDFRLDL